MLFVCTVVGFITPVNDANADLVYRLEIFTGFDSPGWTLIGFRMTTDGTFGAIDASNITDWNIEFTSPYGTRRLTPMNSSAFHVGSNLNATATELKLGLRDSNGFGSVSIVTQSPNWYVTWSGATPDQPARLTLGEVFAPDPSSSTEMAPPGTDSVTFATRIPEPVSTTLLLCSFLIRYGIRRDDRIG